MKSNYIIVLLLLTISAGFVVSAHADSRYVAEMLILTVRDRADQESKVLGNLKSADSVEVLEESGRYLRIRTKDGLEGWVQKNYITSKKPKAIIIEEMQNQINRLNAEIDGFGKKQDAHTEEIRESRQDDKNKIIALEEQVSTLNRELEQRTEKYNALLDESKKNTAALAGERDELKAANKELGIDVDNLKKANNSSPGKKRIQYFLAGAGVLLLGFFIGKSAKRKKSYY